MTKVENIVKEGRGKSQCFVTTGFGEHDGLELLEKVEEAIWKESFASRSRAEAQRILSMGNAQQKAIDWAKGILNQ